MINEEQKKSIVHSWRLVVPIAETAADLFYRRLFELRPDYRKYFSDDMAAQKRKLVTMLAFIVKSLDWGVDDWQQDVEPDKDLCLVVMAMGRRHAELYKIPDDSYGPVGEALLWTLDQGLGEAFTPELRDAWGKLYNSVATTMRMGGKSSKVELELGRVH